jgi:hypothetical protein
MFSFISSFERQTWRGFFLCAVGTALLCVAVIYAFVTLVDPFNTLPLSPPAERWPVATDARFAFPALARSKRFDSAIFGTSTSRLLRPEALNPGLDARFANLAMNDATVYEQARLMDVFRRAHPKTRYVLVGLDAPWCVTGNSYRKLTPRPFPAWMYGRDLWAGYAHMLNMYAVQEAGQEFGILVGVKRPVYGRNGYTSFVPPDSEYDPGRVAMHLKKAPPDVPPGERSGPPSVRRYPALERLQEELARFPVSTRKILFFVPYNHVLFSAAGSEGVEVWDECKRRVAGMADAMPGTIALDFMRPSPITEDDNNYWDALHYRVGVAARVASDIALAAGGGSQNADFRILGRAGHQQDR